jgi:drug/metabolite transporter (DMT)-like permease
VCVLYLLAAGGSTLSAREVGYAALAGAGNAAGLIGFYKAAELGPLSIAAPIGALGAIVPAFWGIATGDRLTALEVGGLVLAIAGAALVARRADDPEEEARYADPRASVFWAIGSAVAFGVFLTAIPAASDGGRAWALLDGRDYVVPDDTERLFLPLILHRLVFASGFLARGRTMGWQQAVAELEQRCFELAPRPGSAADPLFGRQDDLAGEPAVP